MPTRTPIAETLHGPLASVGDDAGVRIWLDRSSPEPLSEQLATAIAERIRRGSLAPGDRLPTVRALAEDLELAPNTVAKAYRALEAQELVEGRGRQGTFVVERLPVRPVKADALLDDAARAFVARAHQLGVSDADARRAVRRAQRSTD
jgi:DNA-binding transcriptional regulator YhcF (GntR family)